MIKFYYTLLLLAVCELSYGQISLDASMAPPLNSMIIYYDANVPSPPFTFSKSGINNTWDFASLSPAMGAEDTAFFFPPSNYAGASSFPTATHATYEGGDDRITMISITAGSASYAGFIGDLIGTGTTMPLAATPPAVSMNFPYTYGSTVNSSTFVELFTTGAAIGQPTIDSVHYKTSLNLNGAVIAAGNMILPSGTLPSLLERHINTTTDTAWMKGAATGNMWVVAPGWPTTTIDSSFYWYSDQSLQHYAHALYDDTGLHDVHYFKSQSTTGITNPGIQSMQAAVFPNPTSDFLNIHGLSLPPVAKWSVYNTAGQKVLEGATHPSQVNVQSLKQGTYILQLLTPGGELHEMRFIKN